MTVRDREFLAELGVLLQRFYGTAAEGCVDPKIPAGECGGWVQEMGNPTPVAYVGPGQIRCSKCGQFYLAGQPHFCQTTSQCTGLIP